MLGTFLGSSNFYFLLAVFQGILLTLLIFISRTDSKPDMYFFFGLSLFTFAHCT